MFFRTNYYRSWPPYSISLICQLLLNETATIAIEEPGFIWIDAKAVYLTPSHQFPTGKIMPISRRLELFELATSQNRLIYRR